MSLLSHEVVTRYCFGLGPGCTEASAGVSLFLGPTAGTDPSWAQRWAK